MILFFSFCKGLYRKATGFT